MIKWNRFDCQTVKVNELVSPTGLASQVLYAMESSILGYKLKDFSPMLTANRLPLENGRISYGERQEDAWVYPQAQSISVINQKIRLDFPNSGPCYQLEKRI